MEKMGRPEIKVKIDKRNLNLCKQSRSSINSRYKRLTRTARFQFHTFVGHPGWFEEFHFAEKGLMCWRFQLTTRQVNMMPKGRSLYLYVFGGGK